jgi:hypothetical protein
MSSISGVRGKRLIVAAAVAAAFATTVVSVQRAANAAPEKPKAVTARDGRTDFDYALGTWTYHLSKLDHPLTGSKHWDEFSGKGVCRPIYPGAQIDELNADSPGGTHIEGLTLRMYNPATHEWSLYWGTQNAGTLGMPPAVGFFDQKNGTGTFSDDEEWHGRPIKLRWIWSNITDHSGRFEQSFSADGGKTWEVNWITTQERAPEKKS